MATPEMSRKYQFQVALRGGRLPVSFTIPDIPDSPSWDTHFVPSPSVIAADTNADSAVTSDADAVSTDLGSTSSIVDSEVDLKRVLLVGASPTRDVQPDRV
jgi:hypothetical protein